MIKALRNRIIILVGLIAFATFVLFARGVWHPLYTKMMGKRTVADVIEQFGTTAENKLKQSFDTAGVNFPPQQIALLAVKEDKVLELWAKNNNKWCFIKKFRVKAASGELGPKLREGDGQVPEGIYKIVGLNPNSSYHLSMKLNYPNEFDLEWAAKESRSNPGSDIFIHGKAASIGCLAMGDAAIEELFYLVYKIGKENSIVVIAPQDPRVKPLIPLGDAPIWTGELYKMIKAEFLGITKT